MGLLLQGKAVPWWARMFQTYIQQFVPIKHGSTNTSYDGDTFTVGQVVNLQSGWTINIPEKAVAIAVRLGWDCNTVGYACGLLSRKDANPALYVKTQVTSVGVDVAGVVPLHQGDCYLQVYGAGVSGDVNIVILGYWL